MISNIKKFLFYSLILTMIVSACASLDLKKRSDMPIRGDRAILYSITEPANGAKVVDNVATLSGVGDTNSGFSPFQLLRTEFKEQPGLKRQDVFVNGDPVLGMTKPQRSLGFSAFAKVEPATICARDAKGNAYCNIKVRVRFNRNLEQQIWTDNDKWDFDSQFFYTSSAKWKGGNTYETDFEHLKLVSLTLTQVTQMKIGWGPSFFFNLNEGAVIIGGKPALMQFGWWRETEDLPGNNNDMMDAVRLLSNMVNDLETSPERWLEFNPKGQFTDSWVMFTAGDADTYATPNRVFLNRQKEYAIGYRKERANPWKFVLIVPSYNFEFNDFKDYVSSEAVNGVVDRNGDVKKELGTLGVTTLKELERIGCQNCPNGALEQIIFKDAQSGKILYSMTLRAYHGANDTLAIFGPERPSWSAITSSAPKVPFQTRPVKVDANNKPLPEKDQPFMDDLDYTNFMAESTVWNWLSKNNPLKADLFVQFRVNDSSEWAPIPCSDGGICGWKATRWNLSSSYFLNGKTRKPWLIMQLLGDSGARTLGMSYVSGRFEGWGGIFALVQDVFYSEYQTGFTTPETLFMFDTRALNTPDILEEAWKALYSDQ